MECGWGFQGAGGGGGCWGRLRLGWGEERRAGGDGVGG